MTTFNVGDKVIRRRDIPYEYWVKWEEHCERRGVNPLSQVTVSFVTSANLEVIGVEGVFWKKDYFTKDHEFTNKTLEDYL